MTFTAQDNSSRGLRKLTTPRRPWGRNLADQQVRFESGLKGLYDYETAWKWALSLSKEERALRFADIVRANRR